LAHVDLETPERLGKYGLDLSVLETFGVKAVRDAVRAQQLVVIDEIRPMEIRSATFRDAVNEVLESEVPLLATIWPRTGLFIRPREDRDRFSSGQWQPQIRAITEHNERQNYALERNHDD